MLLVLYLKLQLRQRIVCCIVIICAVNVRYSVAANCLPNSEFSPHMIANNFKDLKNPVNLTFRKSASVNVSYVAVGN